jgi:hypothetical protein
MKCGGLEVGSSTISEFDNQSGRRDTRIGDALGGSTQSWFHPGLSLELQEAGVNRVTFNRISNRMNFQLITFYGRQTHDQ